MLTVENAGGRGSQGVVQICALVPGGVHAQRVPLFGLNFIFSKFSYENSIGRAYVIPPIPNLHPPCLHLCIQCKKNLKVQETNLYNYYNFRFRVFLETPAPTLLWSARSRPRDPATRRTTTTRLRTRAEVSRVTGRPRKTRWSTAIPASVTASAVSTLWLPSFASRFCEVEDKVRGRNPRPKSETEIRIPTSCDKFWQVWTSISKIQKSFNDFTVKFQQVLKSSTQFRLVTMSSNKFQQVWASSDKIEQVWASNNKFLMWFNKQWKRIESVRQSTSCKTLSYLELCKTLPTLYQKMKILRNN
jgi:hypothetical protein